MPLIVDYSDDKPSSAAHAHSMMSSVSAAIEAGGLSLLMPGNPPFVPSTAPVEQNMRSNRRSDEKIKKRMRFPKAPKAPKAPKVDNLTKAAVGKTRCKKGSMNPAIPLLHASDRIRNRVDDMWRSADRSIHFRNPNTKRSCRIRLVPRQPMEIISAGAAKVHMARLAHESNLLKCTMDNSVSQRNGRNERHLRWAPTISTQFSLAVGYTLAMLTQEAMYNALLVSGETSAKRRRLSADAIEYGFGRLYDQHVKLPRLRKLYE